MIDSKVIPAVLGGEPVLNRGALPSWPAPAGDDTVAEVVDVLRSGKLPMGGRTVAFEEIFAGYCGVKHCLLVTSCTSAMELTLRALGIGPGDEVIIPAVGFISDLTVVMMLGATAVLAEVDAKTCNISPEGIKAAITDKTKAIITLPYSGIPCAIDDIISIAQDKGIPVIEDAAHAHGSEFKGRRIGSWATVSCFSFDQNKVVSSGQGGAIATDDSELYKKLKRMRAFGQNPDLSIPEYLFYTEASGNYKPTDMQAAILIHQLAALDSQIAFRQKQYEKIRAALSELNGISTVIPTPGTERLSHYNMRLEYECGAWGGLDRNLLIKAMLKEGLPVGLGWTPLYYRIESYNQSDISQALSSWYAKLPCAEAASRKTIVITMNLLMADDMTVQRAIEGFRKIYNNADDVREFYSRTENAVFCRSDNPYVVAGYEWTKGNPISECTKK